MFLKRNQDLWVRVLLFYVVVCFINDTILLNLDNFKDRKLIYYVLSVFTIVEYSVFAYFLYSIIENKFFRITILVSTLGFYLFVIIYFLSTDYFSFDSISASIESIFIVSFCILFLFDQLNKPQVIFIYQDASFWFVTGLMVYLSGTLFLFILATELDKSVRHNFWKINLFANIVKNILFAIAFSIKKSKNSGNSLENQLQSNYEHDLFDNPYKS